MAAPPVLDTLALNRALLARQLLLERRRMSVMKAVHALGGLQSQEPRDPFVALWSRLSGFEPNKLMAAARKAQVVRGTYLRGTLHSVAGEDYAAYRPLLQPVLDRGLRDVAGYKHRELEAAARGALADGALTAQQIAERMAPRFAKAQKAHLAQWARLAIPLLIPPSDDRYGYPRPPRLVPAEQLLGDGALKTKTPLADLVLHGLACIGPANAADLRCWSGLTGFQAALEVLRPRLKTFRDAQGRELFDLPDAPRPAPDTPAPVRFLPEYDNVFLSHAERSRIVPPAHAGRFTEARNGRRLRAVLVNGFVCSAWNIESDGDGVTLTITTFENFSKPTLADLEREGIAMLGFLEPDTSRQQVDIVAD